MTRFLLSQRPKGVTVSGQVCILPVRYLMPATATRSERASERALHSPDEAARPTDTDPPARPPFGGSGERERARAQPTLKTFSCGRWTWASISSGQSFWGDLKVHFREITSLVFWLSDEEVPKSTYVQSSSSLSSLKFQGGRP